MRPLPKTYESVHAAGGTTVVVVLNDENRSLTWSLVTDIGHGGTVYPGTRSSIPTAQVIFPHTPSKDSQPAASYGSKQ